jgi:hypothetical protein
MNPAVKRIGRELASVALALFLLLALLWVLGLAINLLWAALNP